MHLDTDLYPWVTVGAIAWGILDCFFGYRVFKVTITILGAAIGAALGELAGTAMGFGTAGVVTGLIVGALLGGGAAFLLYIAAVFLAGFGFGATLGMLLLANYNQMVALLTGAVLGIVGGFVAVKIQKVLLILATALLGAFRALSAMMYFTHRIDWLYYYQRPQQIPALIDSNNWLLPAVLTLAAAGAFVQFGFGGKAGGKKKDKPAKDAN
ncbi:MAG TPA: DUF4203 domain-containing protein [Candidatus Didemnitutus sp.]|nr:DUF4203 domain-containing protein [Candidatus Didemnitutus sp.]